MRCGDTVSSSLVHPNGEVTNYVQRKIEGKVSTHLSFKLASFIGKKNTKVWERRGINRHTRILYFFCPATLMGK